MAGYCWVRNELFIEIVRMLVARCDREVAREMAIYRTAALCSEVWQWWKRSSLSALENDCLSDMIVCVV
jgi:hypothetical protein